MLEYNGLTFENKSALLMYKSLKDIDNCKSISFSNETVISKELIAEVFESNFEMVLIPEYDIPSWHQEGNII